MVKRRAGDTLVCKSQKYRRNHNFLEPNVFISLLLLNPQSESQRLFVCVLSCHHHWFSGGYKRISCHAPGLLSSCSGVGNWSSLSATNWKPNYAETSLLPHVGIFYISGDSLCPSLPMVYLPLSYTAHKHRCADRLPLLPPSTSSWRSLLNLINCFRIPH